MIWAVSQTRYLIHRAISQATYIRSVNRNTRIFSASTNFSSRRTYCSASDDGVNSNNNKKGYSSSSVIDPVGNTNALTQIGVPDNYPNVPVLPLYRNPVFPKFVKLVEVTDPHLMQLIRTKCRLAQPYAGAFLRKDEKYETIYSAGTRVILGLHKNVFGTFSLS